MKLSTHLKKRSALDRVSFVVFPDGPSDSAGMQFSENSSHVDQGKCDENDFITYENVMAMISL